MIQFDRIDQEILYELDCNSRQSLADLSKALGLGRDRIKYRMQKLEREGVITEYTSYVNPCKFGLTLYKTYLKLRNDPTRYARLVDYLKKHPRVYWVGECEGHWNLMFVVFGKDAADFHTVQDEILSQVSDLVMSFNVYTIVHAWFFRRSYLVGFGSGYFYIGGEPKYHELDSLDFELIKLLTLDSRLTVKEIAQRVGYSPTGVKHRIDRLEKLGIIEGYHVSLDLAKIGVMFFKAQVHLERYEPLSEEKLREYCETHPNVTLFVQQLGDCKVELELQVESYEHYYAVIDDIRKKFSNTIRSFESMLIRNEFYKCLPFDFLEPVEEQEQLGVA